MTRKPTTYGRLKYASDHWEIHEAPPHVSMRIKRVFGRIRAGSFTVHVLSDTPDNARDLEWFLTRYPMRMSRQVASRLKAAADEHREKQTIAAELLSGLRRPHELQLALPLRGYQQLAASLARETGSLLLGDDLGIGKTATGIGLLAYPDALPALVVAPKALQLQWEREINRFAPALTVHRLAHGYSYPLAARGAPQPDVVISTYSKLRGWAEILGGWARTVLLDEGHEVRTGPEKSARNAATMHISHRARWRMAMTATPIWNYATELFWLCETLRPGALGSIAEFRREWSSDAKGRLPNPDALGSYLRDIGLFLRRTRKDVGMELPRLTSSVLSVESDPEVLSSINGRAAELARIILKRSEREISSHESYVAGGRLDALVRQATGLAKAPYVAEFVRMLLETGEKVVLYGWHHAVYDLWEERLKQHKPLLFTGQETERQKDNAFQAFLRGDTRLLILSLRAAAGLDGLQYSGCRTVVIGELDWSPGVLEQDIARVWRPGVNDDVVTYYPLAEDGSDPIIANVLGLKRHQLDGVRGGEGDPRQRENDAAGSRARLLAEQYLARIT